MPSVRGRTEGENIVYRILIELFIFQRSSLLLLLLLALLI